MPTPKYTIGEEVYFLEDRRVAKDKITVIALVKQKIHYGFFGDKEYETLNVPYSESDLFKTKDALLASL